MTFPETSAAHRAAPRVRGVVAAVAIVAAASLAGCSGSSAHVTVTVAPPPPSATASPSSTPNAPANPGDSGNPPPAAGSPVVVVSQGAVATECTHSVCHHVHVAWQGLDPGPHDTQCVTDAAGLATWSRSTYNYPTADGERDLGCFLGYPGSHVWVVIDGTIESEHADWP